MSARERNDGGRDEFFIGWAGLPKRGLGSFLGLVTLYVLVGFAAVAFRQCIHWLQSALYGTDDPSRLHSFAETLPWYWILLIPIFGGLIVGVILAMGVPNMQDFTRNSRVTGVANDLHASFYMARSESARSKDIITICASADGADCGGTFADGWIVFQDTNGDIRRDAGESILRSHAAIPTQLSISTPGADDYFSFAPTGRGRGNVTGTPPVSTAAICDDRGNIIAAGGNSAGRVLVVTPLGRATVIRDQAMITTLLNNSGASCP